MDGLSVLSEFLDKLFEDAQKLPFRVILISKGFQRNLAYRVSFHQNPTKYSGIIKGLSAPPRFKDSYAK